MRTEEATVVKDSQRGMMGMLRNVSWSVRFQRLPRMRDVRTGDNSWTGWRGDH